MRRLILGIAAGLGLAACGGTPAGAVGAAQKFIDGVTSGDSHAYCPYVGWLGSSSAPQPPSPAALRLCERGDLFLNTGSCDREAAVSGAEIAGSQVSGARATVELSTGGRLDLQRVQRWLVVSVDSGAHAPKLKSGGCAGA